MKGLVISWFFPPATSAEGLVTFKLLKNSKLFYDVISSTSRQWSYNQDTILKSDNISVKPIEADNFDVWIKSSFNLAEKLISSEKYDFLMTRAMPPESHIIGLKIKRKNPSLFWIASMADPIGHNPYDYEKYFFGGFKKFLKNPLLFFARCYIYLQKEIFDRRVTRKADMLIFPSIEQCKFTFGSLYEKYKNKILIIPHSFDSEFFKSTPATFNENTKITISHLGHLNEQRSVKGLIEAVYKLKQANPELASKLKIRLIGNIPETQSALIELLSITEIIKIEKPVDYLESLNIMSQSDMMLLVDADFPFMPENIFLASKLADYLGADKPILGLTTKNGPSARILKAAGCPVCLPSDSDEICEALTEIVKKGLPKQNSSVYKLYDAKLIAHKFDEKIKQLIEN
jgi:glycosyltransferase involved in cell wall biosynthesis